MGLDVYPSLIHKTSLGGGMYLDMRIHKNQDKRGKALGLGRLGVGIALHGNSEQTIRNSRSGECSRSSPYRIQGFFESSRG
jgi:hypothetical protein